MLTAATTERAAAVVVVVYAGVASTALDNNRLRFGPEMKLLVMNPRQGEAGGGSFASAPPGTSVTIFIAPKKGK